MQRLGKPETPGGGSVAFGDGGAVAADRWTFFVPYPAVLGNLFGRVGGNGGSFVVSVDINGTVVPGLSAVTVSSTALASSTPSGATPIPANSEVGVTISAISGTPKGGAVYPTWSKA